MSNRSSGKTRRTQRIRVVSSGVVVVSRFEHRYRYLLLRAFSYWDFPKGQVEKGETEFEAALREVREETTITQLDFKWGKDVIATGPYSQGKLAKYYLAETDQKQISLPVNPELGRPEHNDYRWVSYKQAETMVSPRVKTVLDWAASYLDKSPDTESD